MVEPTTLAIVTIVMNALHMLLSAYSAHRHKHFSSKCSSCCVVEYDSEAKAPAQTVDQPYRPDAPREGRMSQTPNPILPL